MSNGVTFEILTVNSSISNVILTTEEVIPATLKLSQPLKVALIISSVNKIILFVAKFTLVVAKMIFKVLVMASLVVKITFVLTEITF